MSYDAATTQDNQDKSLPKIGDDVTAAVVMTMVYLKSLLPLVTDSILHLATSLSSPPQRVVLVLLLAGTGSIVMKTF